MNDRDTNKIEGKIDLNGILEKSETSVAENKCDFDCELLIDDNQKIKLKIFYQRKHRLLSKILNVWQKTKILNSDWIKLEPVSQGRMQPAYIDLSHSRIISVGGHEKYSEGIIDIFFDRIKLAYSFKDSKHFNNEFSLNENSIKLIERNYENLTEPFQTDDYNYSLKYEQKEWLEFGKIKFKPYLYFVPYENENPLQIAIKKYPKIKVEQNDLSEDEIRKYVKSICALYSFYSNEKFDYYYSVIFTGELKIEEYRSKRKSIEQAKDGILQKELKWDANILFKNSNHKIIYENFELIERIISTFNLALNSGGEARFMLLYSILEQVRTSYIVRGEIELDKNGKPQDPKKVKDEFKFIDGKDKTNEKIKGVLKQMVEFVDPDDKEEFIKEIPSKVNGIKLISMSNQFISLFNKIEINAADYNLDFEGLKDIRNIIFQNPITKEEDLKDLERVNEVNVLPKFVGHVLLKYFEIDLLKINS